MATVTPKQLAQEFDTDPRTLRKFLRSITPVEDRPGKGSRWEIERKTVRSLKGQFTKWVAEKAPEDEGETTPDDEG